MATHGKVSEFNPQREDWTSYAEQLEAYFIVNNIDGAEDSAAKKI